MSSPLRVLVTGSNKGVGLGLCTAYAERGDDVIGVCRRTSDELSALDVAVIDGVEVTSDEAVTSLPGRIGSSQLDVLICNAGVNLDSAGLTDINVEHLAEMLNVNTLGAVRTVLALLPRMRPGGKIALMGSMGLVPLGILGARTVGNYGYRMSKAALISFGHALAHDVRDQGIAVAITSPGRVDTPLLRNVYAEGRTTKDAIDEAIDIHTAGRLLRDRIDELTLYDSPAYDRDPEGHPAIPSDLQRSLQGSNSTQLTQAGQMAASLNV
jgi:NAD(P)-dependent dehydrogenase (short-subunit alcohol dehydrogenase family)